MISMRNSTSSARLSARPASRPTTPKACARSSKSARPHSAAAGAESVVASKGASSTWRRPWRHYKLLILRTFYRLFLARRDLDELGEAFLAQWRVDELELDRIALNALHVLHLVGLHGRLRVKLLDRVRDQGFVELHLLGVQLDRFRIGVHPVDRFPIPLHEAHDRVFLGVP